MVRCLIVALAVAAFGCKTVMRKEDFVSHVPETEARSYRDTELEKLVALSREFPKVARYHYDIAAIHFQKEDFRESAESLRRAIALTDDERPDPKYHYHLGRVYLRMGESRRAEEQFLIAVENTREERYSGPRAALAGELAKKGDIDGAIHHFERCIGIDPENPRFYYFLGSLHDMKRNDAQAIHYFREYLDRGGVEYRTNAIHLLRKLGVKVTISEPRLTDEGVRRDIIPGRDLPVLPDGIELVPDAGDPESETAVGPFGDLPPLREILRDAGIDENGDPIDDR